jgi:FtsP/CotA-like multicopper oxidase with cupredoxin domain
MVGYRYASVNGRMFGAADPIRVREGDRVLVHVLNASASEAHWITLPGHRFTVVALDGNPVANPKSVEMLRLDPAERVDAIIEMNSPGVWMLGEPRESFRTKGMAIAVEYAGRSGAPKFEEPTEARWDYRIFGRDTAPVDADITRIPLTFQSVFRGHGDFEHWAINGKVYPHTDVVQLTHGAQYRLVMNNQSTEDHPVHLHRHRFEISKFVNSPMSGVHKDVVTVPAGGVVEIDFAASALGKSLFHCHLQDHMDAGFMMLFDCR